MYAIRSYYDELLENHQNPDLQIIDVRSDDEYNGVASHGNNRVGHIPGAIHLEWNKMLESVDDEVNVLLSSEKMKNLLSDANVSNIV